MTVPYRKFLVLLAKVLFTLLLVGILLKKVNLGQSLKILADANLWAVLGMVIFNVFSLVLRSYRFTLICRTIAPVDFRKLFWPYLLSASYGTFVPLGEDVYILVGVNKNWDYASRLTSVFLDRLTGVMGIVLAAALGLALARWSGQVDLQGLVWGLAAVSALGLIALLAGGVVVKYSARVQWGGRLGAVVQKIYWAARRTKAFFLEKTGLCAGVLGLSTVNHLVLNPLAFLCAWLAVGGALSYAPCFPAFVPIVAACTLLPISVLGIGVRDFSFLYLMRTVGANDERVIATTMLVLFVRLVLALSLIVYRHIAEHPVQPS